MFITCVNATPRDLNYNYINIYIYIYIYDIIVNHKPRLFRTTGCITELHNICELKSPSIVSNIFVITNLAPWIYMFLRPKQDPKVHWVRGARVEFAHRYAGSTVGVQILEPYIYIYSNNKTCFIIIYIYIYI